MFATVSRKPCLASLGQGLRNLDCQKTESKEGKEGAPLHPLPLAPQATGPPASGLRTTVALLSRQAPSCTLRPHPPQLKLFQISISSKDFGHRMGGRVVGRVGWGNHRQETPLGAPLLAH